MSPLLRPTTKSSPFADVVVYKKFISPQEDLTGKVVAMMDPFHPNKVLIRKVIGT